MDVLAQSMGSTTSSNQSIFLALFYATVWGLAAVGVYHIYQRAEGRVMAPREGVMV